MNMNIIEKLFAIQQKAVAPKDIDNNFGGFKYRNVEGILSETRKLTALFIKNSSYHS